MESVKINSHYNFELQSRHLEKNFGPSKTQPNDVLSVEEIIRRSANGIPLGNMITGHYDDPELDVPDNFYQMDKLEKMQYARDKAEELHQMKTDYEKSRKKSASPKTVGDEQKSESPQAKSPEKSPEDPVKD